MPEQALAPFMQAIDLCFSRNEQAIFGPLSFSVHAGSALLLKGDNGSGKTTLLRVLAGILEPESGTVLLSGKPFRPENFVRSAAYVGHKHGHKAELTVLQNLRFAAQLRNAHCTDIQISELLVECGLAGYEDTPAGKLSAGQNKRLSLARLNAQNVSLWLLDEPYANLDLAGIAWVNERVRAHIAKGGAALLSSHGAYATPDVPINTLELSTGTRHA